MDRQKTRDVDQVGERRAYPIGLIIALCLAESTVTFETSMIFAAMPKLIRSFGDPFLAGQLVAIHPLIAAATAPLAGRLGDIKGRKEVMLILLALALIGSIISAISSNFTIVLIGRALQGLSVTVMSLAVGVLRESMTEKTVPMGIGFMSTAQGIGSVSGLVLGGAIVDHFNWHWLFAASAVLIAVAFVAVWIYVPRVPSRGGHPPIDWVEALLPIPGISGVLLAIGLLKSHSALSPPVLGALTVSAIILTIWARRALRAKQPFVDLKLFRQRDFSVAAASLLLLGMGTMNVVYITSTYVQSPVWTGVGLGLTAVAAGFAKVPSHFLTVTAGPLTSWLAQRFGHRNPFVAACLLSAGGWLYALTLPNHLVQIVILLCIVSYGTTMLMTANTNIVVDCVPEERTSEAIGTMSVVRSFGLALGGQFIALSLSAYTIIGPDGGAAFPTAESFRLTMGWIATASLLAGAIGLFLRAGQRRPVASKVAEIGLNVES
jgi:MFS family permease